jgi:hypothetical protein
VIAVRKREFVLNENVDLTFSRLKWAVEQSSLWHFLVFFQLPITNRQWVGKLDEENHSFKIMLSSNIFWLKALRSFGQIYLKGTMSQEGTNTFVKVRFYLGPYTIAMFLLIGFFMSSLLIHNFVQASVDRILSIVLLLIFLIPPILPVLLALNKNEDKFSDLMD